jgi:hypothetical protein
LIKNGNQIKIQAFIKDACSKIKPNEALNIQKFAKLLYHTFPMSLKSLDVARLRIHGFLLQSKEYKKESGYIIKI